MLLESFRKWPSTGRSKFAITPGGFVKGDFPSPWSGGVGWNSSSADLDLLVPEAERLVSACLTKDVLATAKSRTRVLTIGADLLDGDEGEHVELVAIVDCDTGAIVNWTGKSYPTKDQETTLVQVADVRSHLIEIADERVLVLGCHDINMFSERSRSNQRPDSPRWRRCEEMVRAAKRFRPTVVLQHPHTTDSPRIWQTAWGGISNCPTVRVYASAIRYDNCWGGKPRKPLDCVRTGTCSKTGVDDVIVKPR